MVEHELPKLEGCGRETWSDRDVEVGT